MSLKKFNLILWLRTRRQRAQLELCIMEKKVELHNFLSQERKFKDFRQKDAFDEMIENLETEILHVRHDLYFYHSKLQRTAQKIGFPLHYLEGRWKTFYSRSGLLSQLSSRSP